MTFSLRYDSRRMPVLADDVVATSQPLAAQAGLEMFRRGGNAIDAALATAITLTVVEPTSNGLGSDAFAQVWHDGALHGFNASGRSPRRLEATDFPDGRIPALGWAAVTVPGAVSSWVELSRRFGALDFEDLFQPAIDYAENGFPVSPQTAASWRRAAVRYADFPEWQRVFAPAGRTPGVGERFRLPDHGRTLRLIADTRGRDFYEGSLAEQMADVSARDGGLLDLDDLRSHRIEEVSPLEIPLGSATVHELPPNGQGLAALIAMGIIDHHEVRTLDPDDPGTIHTMAEAMKIGFAESFRIIADPELMTRDPRTLLAPDRLARFAGMIGPTASPLEFPWSQWNSTVYLATADRDGHAVSFIQSNFEGFGSGVVVDGTGISLQNRATGFHPDPGHPGHIRGGVRPFHTIIPGFVTRNAQAIMPFGIMGGPMQAQGHLQFAFRCLLAGQNPQEALDAPRWRLFDGVRLEVESNLPASAQRDLAARGHEVVGDAPPSVRFGGGQAIHRWGDGWLGASDARRDGQAVGI